MGFLDLESVRLGCSRTSGRRTSSGEIRFLPSVPSFPRESRSSKTVWENPWKSQTSIFQTSAAFGLRGPLFRDLCSNLVRYPLLHDTPKAPESLGEESCRTKVSRIFRIFAPNFAPNFPRFFRGFFVLRFVGDGDHKKFTKNPRHFSMQNSQANTKKIFTKFFWRAGKVTNLSTLKSTYTIG